MYPSAPSLVAARAARAARALTPAPALLATALFAAVVPVATLTLSDPAAPPAAPRILAPRAAAVASGTPVVDPDPTATPLPQPVYVPNVPQRYDPLAPGPLPSSADGFVVELQAEWREQCSPATHVLTDKPPGAVGAKAASLIYRWSQAPGINLDLYIGEYVRVGGLTMLAPMSCRDLTWQMIEVREIEIVERPPG